MLHTPSSPFSISRPPRFAHSNRSPFHLLRDLGSRNLSEGGIEPQLNTFFNFLRFPLSRSAVSSNLMPGTWNLDLGTPIKPELNAFLFFLPLPEIDLTLLRTRNLKRGTCIMDPGTFFSALGTCNMELVIWNLELGSWILELLSSTIRSSQKTQIYYSKLFLTNHHPQYPGSAPHTSGDRRCKRSSCTSKETSNLHPRPFPKCQAAFTTLPIVKSLTLYSARR